MVEVLTEFFHMPNFSSKTLGYFLRNHSNFLSFRKRSLKPRPEDKSKWVHKDISLVAASFHLEQTRCALTRKGTDDPSFSQHIRKIRFHSLTSNSSHLASNTGSGSSLTTSSAFTTAAVSVLTGLKKELEEEAVGKSVGAAETAAIGLASSAMLLGLLGLLIFRKLLEV